MKQSILALIFFTIFTGFAFRGYQSGWIGTFTLSSGDDQCFRNLFVEEDNGTLHLKFWQYTKLEPADLEEGDDQAFELSKKEVEFTDGEKNTRRTNDSWKYERADHWFYQTGRELKQINETFFRYSEWTITSDADTGNIEERTICEYSYL